MLQIPPAPVDAIHYIESVLDASAQTLMLTLPAKCERAFDNVPHVIYLKQGIATVRNASNKKIIFYFTTPSVFTINDDGFSCSNQYFRAETVCDIYQASLLDMLGNSQFLFSLLRVVSYNTDCLFQRDEINNAGCVYMQVRQGLLTLWALPDAVRLNTSLFEFILQQFAISRSSLNKIVKALNQGGYIKTERGKLLSLRHLPLRF